MKPFLYTAKEEKSIHVLLSRAAEPEEAMNAVALHGFCYGLAMTPGIIRMNEWMPVAFGEEMLIFENEADANRLIGDFFAFQNRLVREQNEGRLRFPFDLSAKGGWSVEALKDWAYGLYQAMTLRPEVWGLEGEPGHDEEAPGDVTDLSTSWGIIMALAYPEHIAEIFNRQSFDPETNKEDMTFQATLFALLPGAVQTLQEHVAHQKTTSPGGLPPVKVGRNDPCPCGSGKKYKKCCG